jgi:O-antigen/teichoic acid export membrane protein
MKSNSYWAIADQGIASAGNFATTLLLARALPPAEFGTFVLLNSACVVVLGFQGSLVVSPLVVLGASAPAARTKSYLTAASIFTVILSPISALVVIAAAASLHRMETGALALFFALSWQLQETSRRALISGFRYRDAIWGDAISYLGQALLVGFLYLNKQTSLDRAYALMAVTSLVAVVLQSWQVKLSRFTWNELRTCGMQFWSLGKWLAVASLMSVVAGPMLPWLLNWFHGREAAAAFQAAMNVVGLANPIILSVPGVVMPAVANYSVGSSAPAQRSALEIGMKYTLQFVLILCPLLVFLAIWPHAALAVFYGRSSFYSTQALALRIGVIVYLFTIPMTVLGAVLTGIQRTKGNASMNGIGTLVSLLTAPPLVYFGGVAGAMLAEVASRGARAVWALKLLRLKPAARRVEPS